jgi:4'-phosphopantetheinyl transferase
MEVATGVDRPRRGTLSVGTPSTLGRAVKPTQTGAPAAELHVWRVELDSEGWEGTGDLPSTERDRAEAMRRPRARRRWVAARWALREVLGSYLGEEPAKIELRFGDRGKPMLAATGEPLRFNLSHSGELALIALCEGREVGVDVQRLGSRPLDYYADWTRREAIAKCHGSGLWAQLPDKPVTVSELDAGPGFVASVAAAGPELPSLRQFAAEPNRLCRH